MIFPVGFFFFFQKNLEPCLTFTAANSPECSKHSGIPATICTMFDNYNFVWSFVLVYRLTQAHVTFLLDIVRGSKDQTADRPDDRLGTTFKEANRLPGAPEQLQSIQSFFAAAVVSAASVIIVIQGSIISRITVCRM